MRTWKTLSAAVAVAAFAASAAHAGDVTFKKHDINPKSNFEAAGVFDVDNDGKLDIISGDKWYKGPEFTQSYPTREVSTTGTYRNCFATLPFDVNGDGNMDYVTCSYFGKDVAWVENPGEAGKPWTYHEIDTPGPIEAAVAVDLTGDGQPEYLPNTVNTVVFYELAGEGTGKTWKKYDFGTEAAGHGNGTGDVNGDGRTDLLTPKGWFEAPEKLDGQARWTFHKAWDLGATGIQITARDVNDDGAADIIYGAGHDRGLFWLKGQKNDKGELSWSKPMEIDPTLSSVHTQLWTDLDGDGKEDELVTGKRVYAHEIEPGDVEPSQVAYYTFDKGEHAWKKHPIFTGEAAVNAPKEREKRDAQKDFPAGTAGTGLQVTAIDIDGDGDIDLVCPGKSGLYLFENQTKSK